MDELYIKQINEFREKIENKKSVKDFLKDEKIKEEIISFLENNFDKIEQDNIKNFALRLVHIKGFDEAVPFILKIFKRHGDVEAEYKWKLGNALDTIRTTNRRYIKTMCELAEDKKLGTARQMLISALGKSKDEAIIPILIKLLNDEDVRGHALDALAVFNKPNLKPYFEKFKDYKITWIRNIAKKALKKIES